MEHKEYRVTIQAPKEKVWETLWSEITYPQWTSAFAEGSRAETDWKKGSRVLFLDGEGKGMVGEILENIPNEYMSIKHLGEYKDGQENIDSPGTTEWGQPTENYTLRDSGTGTELIVDMSIPGNYVEYFDKTWPLAFDRLKEISEK